MKRTKHLRETFTDQEFEQLKQAKGTLNWHNFIMKLVPLYIFVNLDDWEIAELKAKLK